MVITVRDGGNKLLQIQDNGHGIQVPSHCPGVLHIDNLLLYPGSATKQVIAGGLRTSDKSST